MLMGTPHRGCGSGVTTGYCATEWAETRAAKAASKGGKGGKGGDGGGGGGGRGRPREGAGALKLRMDISRVARVGQLMNELDESERAALFGLPAEIADSGEGVVHRSAKAAPCSTQRCAILALLKRAVAERDEGDLALYLSLSTNVSSNAQPWQPPERAKARCRQLVVDPHMLNASVERVQPTGAPPKAEGLTIHAAIKKVYEACMRQMHADPRWYTRPFVYGFGREAPIPTTIVPAVIPDSVANALPPAKP